MFDSEQKASIVSALEDCRQQALIQFVDQFVALLEEQGYSLREFLQALASWMFTKKPNSLTVKYLEDAAMELCKTKRN